MVASNYIIKINDKPVFYYEGTLTYNRAVSDYRRLLAALSPSDTIVLTEERISGYVRSSKELYNKKGWCNYDI